ncbi:AP-4 complex subunit epsilon [Olea europaea subsp. europaea]|uniref:AP-4 complex subunit epsilon n=1 Tax=Olea europaea subsp. europaea TaxID=158383 RepID=A0A8S0RUE5_OLEEU|nr:AP-4 complex subunit epsilon [Olea europaea subsp. europaea]
MAPTPEYMPQQESHNGRLEISEVTYSATTVPPFSDVGSSELKLLLDGNGTTQRNSVESANSKLHDAYYDSRKQLVEISPEKQKLAALLFGGASKSDGRQSSSSQKVTKNNSHAAVKSHVEKTATSDTVSIKTSQPPPDLLDLGEPTGTSIPPSLDPFKHLKGLLNLQ